MSDSSERRTSPATGASGTARGVVLLGIGLVLMSTVVYGSTPAFIKVTNESIGLIDLIVYRTFVATAILFTLWEVRRRLGFERSAKRSTIGWRGVALGALLYAPQLLIFFASLQHLDSSLAVALGYIYPSIVILIVSLRAWTRPSSRDLLVLTLAIGGVAAIALPTGGSTVTTIGIVLVMAGTVCYAVFVVVAENLVARAHPLQLAAHMFLGVGVGGVAMGLVSGELTLQTDARNLGLLLLHGLVIAVGSTLYFSGLAIVGATRTSLLDTFQPVVALAVGMLVLTERPSGVQFVGVTLILCSVVVTAAATRVPPPATDSI